VTPYGSGPWAGAWDGRVGSITLYHDEFGRQTQTEIPIIQHQINLFHEKVRDFAEAVRDGKPAPIPGEQILIQQAIIDGVLRSAEAKREVEIDAKIWGS
jgi:predicted dehydrogenase